MLSNAIKHYTNPVRGKLLFEMSSRGQATAKELQGKFPDIPQATLYRYLKMMLADGTIAVAEEKQVRGTIEKTYAPTTNLVSLTANRPEAIQQIWDENDREAMMELFLGLVAGITAEFEDYLKREDVDFEADGFSFKTAPVYATAEELTEVKRIYGDVFAKLMANEPDGKRRLHNLCTIITPPKTP